MQNTFNQPQSIFNFKLIGFMALAAFITFALFVIMQKLIEQDGSYITEPEELVFINPVLSEEDPNTIIKTRIKPPPPPQVKPQPTRPVEPAEPNTDSPSFEPIVGLGTPKITPTSFGGGIEDADSRPIVRISPKYPATAAQQGIEGWVQLEFTIDASGIVKDIKVTDAQPKRIFNREAIRALRKWKYRPQLVNGKPVDLPDQRVVLDININS